MSKYSSTKISHCGSERCVCPLGYHRSFHSTLNDVHKAVEAANYGYEFLDKCACRVEVQETK